MAAKLITSLHPTILRMKTRSAKSRILKMLREDEEFRYAVAGLLGMEDLRVGQERLNQGLAKLEEAHVRLQEAVQKLTEREGALEGAVQRLVERQDALEDAVRRLVERQDSLEGAVQRLVERQDALEDAVRRLVERQDSLEGAVQRLVERQDALEDAVRRLVEAQTRTEDALQELSKHVGRLSDTIGFGLEDIARVVIPGWLYRHEGIEVEELVRKFISVDGEQIEVNLYGEGVREGSRLTILGEARSRIYLSDVEEFDKTVEKVKKTVANKVYKLMFGYYVHPSAEEEAGKRGVRLIASYMR
jgi:peptidoglycan hydrolase CwlO-like protein